MIVPTDGFSHCDKNGKTKHTTVKKVIPILNSVLICVTYASD